MQRDKGETVWVILTVRSEALKEELLRHLRESGISLERVTTIRIDGEPAARFWDGRRRNQKSAHGPAQVGRQGRPPQQRWLILLPVIGVGLLSCVAAWSGILPLFTSGTAFFSFALFTLLFWWLRAEWPPELSTRRDDKTISDTIPSPSPAGPATGPVTGPVTDLDGAPGVAGVGEVWEQSRPATFLIGLKIEQSERSRVERIAIDTGAGLVLC